MHLSIQKHVLNYLIPARTSRGEYREKQVLLLCLENGKQISFGEISPLPDLSIDGKENFELLLPVLNDMLEHKTGETEIMERIRAFPALQFALECCFLGNKNARGLLFQTPFTKGLSPIAINGLVWMSTPENMLAAGVAKAKAGYGCIKFKVGANDHDNECRMLENLRKQYPAFKLEIRLDANGAYSFHDTLSILKDFSKFGIDSLEQPIAAGQWEAMEEICAKSPIPIALDEELIGIDEKSTGPTLLAKIKPQYLVLKPTLLGGFTRCDRWISLAQKANMGWWATSALESNVGLGHIAQWVSAKTLTRHQGLGTGQLYEKNFPSSTRLDGENLWFLPDADAAVHYPLEVD